MINNLSDLDQHTQSRQYEWPISGTAVLSESYDDDKNDLLRLYQKAKSAQWNVERDLDWGIQLDPDNPLGMHDGTLLLYGTPLWEKLDDTARTVVRQHSHSWTVSQLLHGEQAALICASRLAQSEDDMAAKLCAAVQVVDEARHVEAYAKLADRMITKYSLSPALKGLLQDTITSSELDITNLGMQILVEGVALAIFNMIVAYSRDGFIKELVSRIQRDEARHFAVGRITLEPLYRELSDAEIRVREEFVCEGFYALHEHLCADDIWEPTGLSPKQCKDAIRESPLARALRRALFRRLVPSIRDMSLLTPRVRSKFETMGVLDYEHLPNLSA